MSGVSINSLKILWGKGLFHMFGAKVINQIIIFCSGMLLVRILSKENYGIYSYIQNTLAFFLLLDGLGATTGLLQYGSKNFPTERMYAFFKLSLKQGIFGNLIIAGLIIGYAVFFVKDQGIQRLFFLTSFLPLFSIIFSIIQIYNIVRRENKFYSLFTTINTILYMGALILGAYFWNIAGIFILNYVASILTIIVGCAYLHYTRDKYPRSNIRIEKKEINEYRKFSLVAMGSNAISHIVLILDVFLIGLMIGDMKILASFKTATLIPFGLLFLPSTIMTFVYPYFAKNSSDTRWVKTNYLKLVKILSVCFVGISVILILTSSWMIPLIFGEQYSDSILPYNILCIGFFFAAAFRSPAGNTLAALGKVNANLYIAVATGIVNIALDILLIRLYGSVGAAITSTLVFFLTAVAGNIVLYYYLRKGAYLKK